MAETQTFEFFPQSLRSFFRAVQNVSKLGKDAALIFRQGELGLRGADDAHVTALHFVFSGKLFRSSHSSKETKVVVTARQLLMPVTGAQQKSEGGLRIRLCGPRIFLEFASRGGLFVSHGVPLLETLPFLPDEPVAGPHAAALAPSLLARVMLHCVPKRSGGSEEVTLGAAPSEGLRVKSEDLTSTREEGSHRTEVLLQMSDLEACSLDPTAALEVRFPGRGLRDFAHACEYFARDLDSLGVMCGSALLELRFGEDSGSVVCSFAVASMGSAVPVEDFRAVFMVCIREATTVMSATPQPPTASPQTKRPQRQGAKRRAIEVPQVQQVRPPDDFDEFDAFPESSSSQPRVPQASHVIDLTQVRPTQPTTQTTEPTEPARSQLQLFTAEQKAQILHSQPRRDAPPVPPFLQPSPTPPEPATQRLVPPVAAQVPNGIAPVPNGTAAPHVTRPNALPNRTAVSVPNGASSQPTGLWWQGRAAAPVVMATLSPQPHTAGPALASHLDAFDSDDELIGADPDEIAFARGDQEEEAPDWFDCERLW